MKTRPGQQAGPMRCPPTDPVHEAVDCDIDLAMLRDNLALSVAQRLRRHDIALTTVEMLQKARRL
ncbi:MAG: hypothetical protein KBE65_10845 [Phycisphaerae bacterium]|nr:hypothetical protein [Phycisphaerae bacterium]